MNLWGIKKQAKFRTLRPESQEPRAKNRHYYRELSLSSPLGWSSWSRSYPCTNDLISTPWVGTSRKTSTKLILGLKGNLVKGK
jgi:hypothetical protein